MCREEDHPHKTEIAGWFWSNLLHGFVLVMWMLLQGSQGRDTTVDMHSTDLITTHGVHYQALEARRLERQWRERVQAFMDSLEKQKEETRDITSDMLRQYKVRSVYPFFTPFNSVLKTMRL